LHQIVHEMEADILNANRKLAEQNRTMLRKNGVMGIDFLGSIGSGKTLLIEELSEILRKRGVCVGAIAGDVAGDDDYSRFRQHGLEAVNINTGKECHLDAHLVEHALENLDLKDIDVLFIENVGNLVCPADFPLGSERRAVVISVTEGDDIVRKHPLIFSQADIIVINKVDLAEAIEVDPQILVRDARKINPHAEIILTDARHGKGLHELLRALELSGKEPEGNNGQRK